MLNIKKLTYYATIFFFTYLIYVYPFDVLNNLFFKEPILKFSSILFSFIFCLIVIFYFNSRNTSFLLKLFVYEGAGIGFISFWVVNLGLIAQYFFAKLNLNIGAYCVLLIILITLFSLINARSINLKKLTIRSSKINKQIKLIFISDIHLGSNSKKILENIYKIIKNLKYDFLLIGGDFIDSSSFDLNDLKILKNFKKPILFISGNHEYYLKDCLNKLKKLGQYGIKFLDNKALKFKNINFIGISDNQTLNDQEKIANNLIHKNFFNLVLVHKPSLWTSVNDKIDLMLSGHTHNGQIFPFNLFVRLKFKNIYGLYIKGNSSLYVSSGSGCWGPKMRLGSKNEIIEILIQKKEKHL